MGVGSIMIALLTKLFPLFTSKVFFFCRKLLSNTMFEIPRVLSDALILAIGVVLGIGLLSLLLQLGKTHILLKKLLKHRAILPKDLRETIGSLGLTDKVILIRDRSLSSFCYGILSPRLVITTSLVKSLTDKELEAVLLHEQSHLISRDPVKVLMGKTLSSMFFFLPVFGELHRNSEAVNEFLADQRAINHQKQAVFLRGALKKILASPQLSLAAASNASGPDYFEIRIQRLVNPGVKFKFNLSPVSWVTTILFIFLSWFIIRTPANAFHVVEPSNPVDTHCFEEKLPSRQCYPSAHLCSPLTNSNPVYYTK